MVRMLRLAVAATALALVPAGGAAASVWLCRPGLKSNPCTSPLTATVLGPRAVIGIEHAEPARHPAVDCFYVYPTVSDQQTTNANLHIDPVQRGVAVLQASRFSQVCRVFAPMYPQLTLKTILEPGGITAEAAAIAYAGVRDAFVDYLERFNRGRGIVFIGHSQGASMLTGLLRAEVDGRPALRRRLVSALLIGANVTVRAGRRTGGSFERIPACARPREAGCVVAYSAFSRTPQRDAYFGRVSSGLNPFAPDAPNLRVLCVNPAGPGRGRAPLRTYFPSTGPTPWVAYPGEYRAHCKSGAGASWLQVNRLGGKADRRPAVGEVRGGRWGLHAYDVNLALGNLVALVRAQARAYRARR